MGVRQESVTHLVVKLFNVKSKFDYMDKNKQKSEIANNQVWEAKVMMPVIFKRFVGPKLLKNCSGHRVWREVV
jgi:hypothetical protein